MQQFTPNSSSKAMNREVFKVILMGLMVLDHLEYFISPYLADVFHILTRVVAVGFGYLVVEGLYYTHSRKDYLLRLGGFGGLMMLGNILMNLFVLRKQYAMSLIGDNIFLTLTLGALIICLWDNHQTDLKRKRFFKVLSIILLVLGCLPILEGSFVVIPVMFITQLTHQNVKKRNLWYLGLMILYIVVELPMALSAPTSNNWLGIFDSVAMNASDIFFIFLVPMLHFYNGKLGRYSTQMKYVFYLFYPLHLWIIHLIANFM
ncbi:hypothetical protein FD29_GL001403 [Companilactobacillus mindensis DSM 14500]|uniref:TraX family protein n=1 Tax=Companilactobacillus mindensis DSM 14500 TaxID=1423770 RepID=A0A0R1QDS5_9LACO|nr:TraX family protein [Companilactobacillus mindensis]KRL42918.1 hypothetical protein FD29_GL001403 [Companilactobacillus mindensis DSM 14500]GEO78880.1 hypothetical protein LMI01_12110 [Companilactobacillus mindensis]